MMNFSYLAYKSLINGVTLLLSKLIAELTRQQVTPLIKDVENNSLFLLRYICVMRNNHLMFIVVVYKINANT